MHISKLKTEKEKKPHKPTQRVIDNFARIVDLNVN